MSSRAFSSAQLRSPYSSTNRGWTKRHTFVEQEALFAHPLGRPPTSTVAVEAWPPKPVESTFIVVVPWPLVIFEGETVQSKVRLTDGSAPEAFATNFNVKLSSRSGHVTVTTGQ